MTVIERLDRMEQCVYYQNGDCLLDACVPYDCAYCNDFVDKRIVKKEEREEERLMSATNLKVYMPVDELWGFYAGNQKRCAAEMILIAENTSTKYAIYMTDEDGQLMFSVCKGDKKPEYEEFAINDDDCAETAKKLFLRYLVPFSVTDGQVSISEEFPNEAEDDDACPSRQDIEDEMYEREDELDIALKEFLVAVLQVEDSDAVLAMCEQECIGEILNHFLEYLSNEQGLEVFRPMFILDEETGCEVYSQFPYEEYDFSKGADKGGDSDA